MTRQEHLSWCYMCCMSSSRKVIVEDGRIVDIEKDLESNLPTEWCPSLKCKSPMEIYYHPDRLKYPLKRVGERGKGKYQRISWDEALDTIAKKLNDIKEKYGPEYVALLLGEPKGMEFHFAQRFATVFGTPNVITPGHVCGQPATMGAKYTFGSRPLPDEGANRPKLIISWGSDFINHCNGVMHRETFKAALSSGAKVIVIDPKKINIAKKADLWIRPRPASDCALAMGVIKVLIEENLYDADFVARWTVGFDKLQEHVKTFTLEDVERVTWVPHHQIQEFARMYARLYPSCIVEGNALDQSINAFQTGRAINIMRALVGKINLPGGDIFLTAAPVLKPGRFIFPKDIPTSRDTSKSVGKDFIFAARAAFVPTQAVVKAILEEKPHPIKAVLFLLTNPLVSYANSEETYRALMKLDFIAGADIFPTPTTALADIVLPAAWGNEQETPFMPAAWTAHIKAIPKLIDPPGEAWPDSRWINELARRLGLKGFWESETEAFRLLVQPSGLTWEEFKKKRFLDVGSQFKRPEDGLFTTPSGKAEIYSESLKELGFSPMPLFQEVSLFRFELSKEYPLLMTNGKEPSYYLSGYKHVTCLRKKTPQPKVELHPDTAKKAGLKEGDWVWIENKTGRIKQILSLNATLDPRIVWAAFGWWFPEEPECLFQFMKSNLNVLTSGDPPYDPQVGTTEFRGIPCRVYKA